MSQTHWTSYFLGNSTDVWLGDQRSLRAMLEVSGFEVTQAKYVGYTRQFQPDWINTQEEIWRQIGKGEKPNFRRAAWWLLFRTALASRTKKYDSIRVQAKRTAS